ncbi:hypothetical protein ACOSQ4_009901 [Xanthoceras sorbifolium]
MDQHFPSYFTISVINNIISKKLQQHQSRTQQNHTQISFAATPKSSSASQGQQPPRFAVVEEDYSKTPAACH